MAEKVCSIWEKNWSETMPDGVVAKAIRKGVVDPGCLPPDRQKRMGLIAEK